MTTHLDEAEHRYIAGDFGPCLKSILAHLRSAESRPSIEPPATAGGAPYEITDAEDKALVELVKTTLGATIATVSHYLVAKGAFRMGREAGERADRERNRRGGNSTYHPRGDVTKHFRCPEHGAHMATRDGGECVICGADCFVEDCPPVWCR